MVSLASAAVTTTARPARKRPVRRACGDSVAVPPASRASQPPPRCPNSRRDCTNRCFFRVATAISAISMWQTSAWPGNGGTARGPR